MRTPYKKLGNGMTLYKVQLVGGPHDGVESLCTHDTVYHGGERYTRDAEDRYVWNPEKEEPCSDS
jgi:hypothetical protein